MTLNEVLTTTKGGPMEGYVMWAQLKGHRPESIKTRLMAASAYQTRVGTLTEATDATVLEFLNGYTGWTRSTYARALKSVFIYLAESGQIAAVPTIPKVKSPDPRPKPVKDAELKRLIETAPRDLCCWYLLAAYGGLRASEIAASGPAYLDGNRLELPLTKGGGSNSVFLPTWVVEDLRQCPQWKVSARLVSSKASLHMRSQGVTPGIHRLRHWHATTLLRQTHDLRLVQKALRHRSITSTTIYTAIEDDELAAAVSNINRVA